MTDGFTTKLESYSKRIRRWATRREIERKGYGCEVWYDGGGDPGGTELPLSTYLDPYATADFRDNGGYYAPYEGEVWNHVHAEFDWVHTRIMEFGKSQPSALESLITAVQAVPTTLLGRSTWRNDGDLGGMHQFETRQALTERYGHDDATVEQVLLTDAMDVLSDWRGATAGAFTTTFGSNGGAWEGIAEQNYYLAEHLLAGLEAQLAVNTTTRESVIRTCSNTIEALWDVNEGGGDASTFLTIFGAVASVALVSFPLAGAITAAAFAITTELVNQAQSDSGDVVTGAPGSQEHAITGATPAEILDCMASAFDKIILTAAEHEDTLRDTLYDAYNAVTSSAGARSTFEITFEEGTSMDDMGDREVSVSDDELKEAATVHFPRATQRVLGANADLAASHGGESAAFAAETGSGTTAAHPAWTALRDLLQDLTATNGGKLEFAGQFLYDFAVETGVVDADNAEAVNASNIYADSEPRSTGSTHEPIPVVEDENGETTYVTDPGNVPGEPQ
ncbi:hypothetical protein [Stackebrandtia nassauensis]|uniref:Uncharacterized protein n=1 Tax=Stackebrandtia nassauensis (strain DSM 44728 / CIP 108903 / NRRL B-16338 / NBRC 102104 / LLR-40K-21) TaxID=446470 RepID=D3QA79_STANL|nr:hypothetical protein [Stackebrandtia nassauensis]ADD40791.1 hypothetical protein Snas_1081 [Stackebrandtia nassauensis DSM 44728]